MAALKSSQNSAVAPLQLPKELRLQGRQRPLERRPTMQPGLASHGRVKHLRGRLEQGQVSAWSRGAGAGEVEGSVLREIDAPETAVQLGDLIQVVFVQVP